MTAANNRQSIFITGAASGMGRETARLFAGKGWFVGCYDVDANGLETLKGELGGANGLYETLDVTDRTAYMAVLDRFGAATGGKLDLLFNNAGIGRGGPFDLMPFEDVIAVVQVNLMGVLIGIHAAAPLLKATKNSLCFTTSSSSATYGMAGIAVYSATKHAVKGLTEALAVEFRAYGVRVADALPGLIDTAILPDAAKQSAPKEGMWRLIPPVDIAQVVWDSYHDAGGLDGKIHWYVPPELHELDMAATATPEAVRAQMAAGGVLQFNSGGEG